MPADPLRVVVVDDQALVRGGFPMILGTEPGLEVVGEAGNGEEAVVVCREARPDVVLMDIRMPVLDGVEATRRITAETRRPGAHADDVRPRRVRLRGHPGGRQRVPAQGRAGPRSSPDAVRTVARGDALLAPVITRRLLEQFVGRPSPGRAAAALERLTDREREVLGLVGRGLSNSEIAAALFVSETTAKTHVSRILTKLALRDRVQAVVLAYESGLVRPGEQDAHQDRGGESRA